MKKVETKPLRTISSRPDTWGYGGNYQHIAPFPRLTDIERTWIDNYCKEPTPPATHSYYVPGEPLREVASVGGATVKRIRLKHLGGSTLKELSLEHDLREEWIQEILKNPKKEYFNW